MIKPEQKNQIFIAALVAIIIFQWIVFFGPKPQKVVTEKKKPKPHAQIKGRIAIVLDDWGYNLNNVAVLESIPAKLTVSVLPHLTYSAQVAGELNKQGVEVILHLPLEPKENLRLEKNTILTSMDAKTQSALLASALESLGNTADGVSNHMGSKATEHVQTMDVICKYLAKKRMFYLDSYVTANSICRESARKAGIKFAKRDVFLDNKEDPEYIKNQIVKLKQKARQYGYAVGIGHDRKNTLLVLKEIVPLLQNEGYAFVFVSELAD